MPSAIQILSTIMMISAVCDKKLSPKKGKIVNNTGIEIQCIKHKTDKNMPVLCKRCVCFLKAEIIFICNNDANIQN